MSVSVALCTYNGEKFLREQLDSIARQTRLPDELVVCDDCSRDRTLEILREFQNSSPFAIRIFPNETNLGPVKNFEKAIKLCQGKWIALCDQDDLWLPIKLEISAQKMGQMEAAFGESTPLLVHTDAIVADSNLNVIEGSLWKFQRSFPQKGHDLGRLLSQNIATGCTVTINRALRDKAFPIPENAVMHDWWLALVASALGQIGHIPEPTIRYRQHGRNDTGAKKWSLSIALRMLFDFKNREHVLKGNKEISKRIRKQAEEFLQKYNGDLSSFQKNALAAFVDLPNCSYFRRKYFIVKYGLHYHGFIRNVGNLLLK